MNSRLIQNPTNVIHDNNKLKNGTCIIISINAWRKLGNKILSTIWQQKKLPQLNKTFVKKLPANITPSEERLNAFPPRLRISKMSSLTNAFVNIVLEVVSVQKSRSRNKRHVDWKGITIIYTSRCIIVNIEKSQNSAECFFFQNVH